MHSNQSVARVPHVLVLLLLLLLTAAALTHLLPAGEYDRRQQSGRAVPIPTSYHRVEPNPIAVRELLAAIPRSLALSSELVLCYLVLGGTLAVLSRSKALEVLVERTASSRHMGGLSAIAALMFAFSIAGATLGIAGELLLVLPALCALMHRQGHDRFTATAVALLGAGVGVTGTFVSPFTLGVAQELVGLPLASGLWFRLAVWFVLTASTIGYVVWYAKRTRTPPVTTDSLSNSPLRAHRAPAVLSLLFLTFAGAILGTSLWAWGLRELTGAYAALGILAGILSRQGINGTAEQFASGVSDMGLPVLAVCLARAIPIVLEDARVADTLVHALTTATAGASVPTLCGLYLMQLVLAVVVPSGSAQAALTVPLAAAVGDIAGITRQTVVLAYQFGDGFVSLITPTQPYLVTALALVGIKWHDWARFLAPLFGVWLLVGLVSLLVAHALRLGPF